MKLLKLIVWTVAVCLPLHPALALIANYTPFIVGGRAAGMGGAVSATATDSDAAYHNLSLIHI